MSCFDKMSVENIKLKESIRIFNEKNTNINEQKFINELLISNLLILIKKIEIDKTANGQLLDVETTIEFIHLDNKQGQHFLPLFTDSKELDKWEIYDSVQVLTESFEKICTLVSKNSLFDGVVIDPFGGNIPLTTQQLEELSKISKQHVVKIGEPTKYPKKLIDKLNEYFPSLKSVKKVYLLCMLRDGEESYLLVIDTENVDKDFPVIWEYGMKYLHKNEVLDLVSFNTEFGKNTVKNYQPFYSSY